MDVINNILNFATESKQQRNIVTSSIPLYSRHYVIHYKLRNTPNFIA